MFSEWLPHLQGQAREGPEDISPADKSNSHDNQLLSEDTSTQKSGKIIGFYCSYSADFFCFHFLQLAGWKEVYSILIGLYPS